jgi:hypothetical protein
MSDYKEVQYGNVVSLMTSGFQTELDSVIFVIHGFYTDIFELPYPLNVVKGMELKEYKGYGIPAKDGLELIEVSVGS